MNLKNKFDRFLREHGHRIYFLSVNPQLRCSCYREKDKDGDPNCKECFGTGFKVSIKSYIARRTTVSDTPLANAYRVERPGETEQGSFNYFLQSFVRPKAGDYIIETVRNQKGNIIGVSMVYLISHATPQNYNEQMTVFYKCSTRAQPTIVSHFWKSLIWHMKKNEA